MRPQALVLEELKALIGQLDPATKATMKNSLYRISRNAAVSCLVRSSQLYAQICFCCSLCSSDHSLRHARPNKHGAWVHAPQWTALLAAMSHGSRTPVQGSGTSSDAGVAAEAAAKAAKKPDSPDEVGPVDRLVRLLLIVCLLDNLPSTHAPCISTVSGGPLLCLLLLLVSFPDNASVCLCIVLLCVHESGGVASVLHRWRTCYTRSRCSRRPTCRSSSRRRRGRSRRPPSPTAGASSSSSRSPQPDEGVKRIYLFATVQDVWQGCNTNAATDASSGPPGPLPKGDKLPGTCCKDQGSDAAVAEQRAGNDGRQDLPVEAAPNTASGCRWAAGGWGNARPER